MSRAVRSRSMKHDRRSHAAVATTQVEEDFLAVDREDAVDGEVISCVSSWPESRGSET